MKLPVKKESVNHLIRSTYWFLVGFILSGALLFGAVLFYFQHTYKDKVIPGIFIDNIYIGEKNKEQIEVIFNGKNELINKNEFIFAVDGLEATVSAKTLGIGYDINLITEQSLGIGKTKNLLSDLYIIASSYINGTFLHSVYTFDDESLESELKPIIDAVYLEPENAQFNVENGRVTAFKESKDGKSVDIKSLKKEIDNIIPNLMRSEETRISRVPIPVIITEPETTTEEANDLGIVEEIGEGNSTFFHSIPNRIHNVALAANRTSGVIIAPGEEFSFAKAIGDISKFTGYKEAYVISGGKTILGDGGGVCQVSTTLFRAVLNAGLPITERHSHAYRVGYYEQDSPPGYDATVFVPSVDFRFKNDTENHILVQSYVDTTNLTLRFVLYGKRDGREVVVSQPVISNVAPAPEPLYQDDPTLPAGVVKQVDYAAPGAKSVFTRTVTKNGETIISDTFVSNYRPWQAVFLRGTGSES